MENVWQKLFRNSFEPGDFQFTPDKAAMENMKYSDLLGFQQNLELPFEIRSDSRTEYGKVSAPIASSVFLERHFPIEKKVHGEPRG